MRRIWLILLLLCMTGTAFAAETPDLPGLWSVHGLPKKTTFPVYTGPGEEYFVAAEGKAKVSTNGSILCYGRVGDWLMIRYTTDSGIRVGYIDAGDYPDVIGGFRELTFGSQRYRLSYSMPITDNPDKDGKNLGTISGEVTLLAYAHIAGNRQWAYIEGVLDKRDGAMVRGFVKLDRFASAELLPAMPDAPRAEVGPVLLNETTLQTTTVPVSHLRVLPLEDETLALLYCDAKSTLVQRLDRTGALQWSSRVFAPSEYTALAPTEEGFTASFYYNGQLMAYTYPLDSEEGVFSSSYPSLSKLRAAESQSDAAEQMPVPVLRAAAVGEISQGTMMLACFDDGSGLYLLTEDGLYLLEAYACEAELCDPADENGLFTLLLWGDGQPVLRTYQCQ